MDSTLRARPIFAHDRLGPLAAVDLGSNSFRLELAWLDGGRYECIASLKERVRLGAGLDARGRLDEDAAQRGLSCLARFAQRLRAAGVRHVRAVGTQTLREASNRGAFLARAQAVLGHPVEVLPGREEARLVYAGVARLQPSPLPRLVIDIGGRSTELALGRGEQLARAESFAVGSIGLSMRCFADGRLTPESFRAARGIARDALAPALAAFGRGYWQQALGSSGTVEAVSRVLAAAGVTDGSVTPAGLRWLIGRCLRAGHVDRLALPGLQESRRSVIGGGLAILSTLAGDFGIERLQLAHGALRHGLILDLEWRLRMAPGNTSMPPLARPA